MGEVNVFAVVWGRPRPCILDRTPCDYLSYLYTRAVEFDNVTDTPSHTPAGPVHRIGVVEDHEAVVMGLEAMLAPYPSLMVCGSAPTVSALVVQELQLDLAILDLRLADGSSPKTNVDELRAAGLETLIFTAADNP